MAERNPRLDPDGTLPVLPGWVGITEAGERLGYTRQHAYRLAASGHFKTLSRVGTSHIFVISEQEIDDLLLVKTLQKEE